jgi:addiction module HigA family antidote
LVELGALPSNRLEALRANRLGQYSIRVNVQWRICFKWPEGAEGPSEVEIVDYHGRNSCMSRPAIHPGEVLGDELTEIGVTPAALAREIAVPPNRISQILRGRRNITGDTALRLGHWFGTSPRFWLNLQSSYDIRLAQEKAGEEIAQLPVRGAGRVSESARE